MKKAITSYDILNVPHYASQNDIHAAYRKLAMAWHPDRHDAATRNRALDNFKQLQDAYALIKTPEKRVRYNQFLKHTKTINHNTPFKSLIDALEKIFWPSNQNKQG